MSNQDDSRNEYVRFIDEALAPLQALEENLKDSIAKWVDKAKAEPSEAKVAYDTGYAAGLADALHRLEAVLGHATKVAQSEIQGIMRHELKGDDDSLVQ